VVERPPQLFPVLFVFSQGTCLRVSPVVLPLILRALNYRWAASFLFISLLRAETVFSFICAKAPLTPAFFPIPRYECFLGPPPLVILVKYSLDRHQNTFSLLRPQPSSAPYHPLSSYAFATGVFFLSCRLQPLPSGKECVSSPVDACLFFLDFLL